MSNQDKPKLSKLEVLKLEWYRQRFGAMTSDEILECAINAEEFKRSVGFGDIAFTHFSNEQTALTEFALLTEKEENSK